MAFGDDLKVEMDAANLYREEMITDRKMGVIHVLTPVTAQGEKDTARACIFTGEVQIMTQMLYGEAAKKGVQETIEKMQQLRREAASKIVTPGTPGFGVPPAAGTGGIQMP